MMMLHRQEMNDQDPKSLSQRFKHSEEGRDYLKDMFKVAGPMSVYNKAKQQEKLKSFKLTEKDMADFTIPVQMCIDYCKAMQSLEREMRPQALIDAGIKADYAGTRVTWEEFLKLNERKS